MKTQVLIKKILQKVRGKSVEMNKFVADGLINTNGLDMFWKQIGVSTEIEALKKRQFLRVTAFPGCNLRCSYCNPEGLFGTEVLETEAVLEIIRAAHELGISIVHFTGGEPTERTDFVELVKATKEIGIEIIDVTTNGIKLGQPYVLSGKSYSSMVEALHAAGLTGVSLSLDSLNPRTFEQIALTKDLPIDASEALSEIKKAVETTCGLIKTMGKFVVNMVVTKINFHEISEFLAYARELDGRFIPRFCELQNRGPAFGENQDQFFKEYVTRKQILRALKDSGIGKLLPLERESVDKQNAHAEYFEFGSGGMVIGVVAPYSQGWPCAKGACKRIRIGPLGATNSCLESPTFQLRDLTFAERKESLRQSLYQKILRVINNEWPLTHGTDYLRLRFGLKEYS